MPEVLSVHNMDIVAINNRVNRFIEEMYKSSSSSVSNMSDADKLRMMEYIDAIDVIHDWIIGQPQVDLPDTTPKDYPIKKGIEILEVENESVNDMLRMMVAMRDEMGNSQSSRMHSGLIKQDSERLRAITERCRQFYIQYINVVTPLDYPESSPQEVTSGHGRQGI